MGGGGSGQGRRHGVAAGGSAWGALRAAWGCVGWSWGRGPCGRGKGVEGRWRGRLYQPSSLGIAGPFPGPWRPVLGGRGVPGDGAWHWDVRAPDTVSTPPIGSARALSSGASHPAPSPWVELGSTQGVVWCGVVWCGVVCVVWCGVCGVWCGVVWCGVVWCGVVWCGVVWCGVVWCGVVWCGVVWCGVVWCGVVWCGVVWCGVVRCGVGWGGVGWGGVGWGGVGWSGVEWGGVVWCGVVWCGVVWCGVVWCGVVWCGVVCGVVWCGVVWCGVVWCGVVWCGVVWCGVVWCGVVWCGVVVFGGAPQQVLQGHPRVVLGCEAHALGDLVLLITEAMSVTAPRRAALKSRVLCARDVTWNRHRSSAAAYATPYPVDRCNRLQGCGRGILQGPGGGRTGGQGAHWQSSGTAGARHLLRRLSQEQANDLPPLSSTSSPFHTCKVAGVAPIPAPCTCSPLLEAR